MNNATIIESEKELHGITVEVDTFAGWKYRGYKVKKGEHAVFQTKIWKMSKVKIQSNNENGDEQQEAGSRFILVPAHFFTKDQVELYKKGE
jgi:hypothetical protein